MAEESGSKTERKSSERSCCETDMNGTDFNSSRENLLAKSGKHSDSSENKSKKKRESKSNKKHLKSDKILSKNSHEKKANEDALLNGDVDNTRSKEERFNCTEKTEHVSSQNKSKQNDKICIPGKEENRFTKSTNKIDVAAKSGVEKGKDLMGEVSEGRKKDKNGTKLRLVAYSDDSSEEQDGDSRSQSKINGDTSRGNRGEKDTGKRVSVNSSSSREGRTGITLKFVQWSIWFNIHFYIRYIR